MEIEQPRSQFLFSLFPHAMTETKKPHSNGAEAESEGQPALRGVEQEAINKGFRLCKTTVEHATAAC